MKNKKSLIIIICVILLIVMVLLKLIIPSKKDEKKIDNTNNDSESKQELLIIKNDEKHKLEKNNIKVDRVEVYTVNNSIQVITTLINNSDEDMNGFFAYLEFFDKDDNKVFAFAKSYGDKFPSKGKVQIENIIPLNEKTKKVSNVKILHLEKRIEDTMDDAFSQMGQ